MDMCTQAIQMLNKVGSMICKGLHRMYMKMWVLMPIKWKIYRWSCSNPRMMCQWAMVGMPGLSQIKVKMRSNRKRIFSNKGQLHLISLVPELNI